MLEKSSVAINNYWS